MTNDVTQQGWYPDPMRGSGERWWDGTAWTDRTRDAVLPVPRGAEERESGPVHQPTAARRALPPEDDWDDDDLDDDEPIRLGARSASSPLHWQSPTVLGTPSEPTTASLPARAAGPAPDTAGQPLFRDDPRAAPVTASAESGAPAANPYLPPTPDTGSLPAVRTETAAPHDAEAPSEQTSQLPAQRGEIAPAHAERGLETPSRGWVWWLLVPAALLLLVAILLGIQLTVPGGLASFIDRIVN